MAINLTRSPIHYYYQASRQLLALLYFFCTNNYMHSEQACICPGNPDDQFLPMITAYKAEFVSASGVVKAQQLLAA